MRIFFSMVLFIIAYYFWPDKSYDQTPFAQWTMKMLGDYFWGYAVGLYCGYQGCKLFGSALEEDRIFKKWTWRYFVSLLVKATGILGMWGVMLCMIYALANTTHPLGSDALFYIGIGMACICFFASVGLMMFSEHEVMEGIYNNLIEFIPKKFETKFKNWLSI